MTWPPQVVAALVVLAVALLAMVPSLTKQVSDALLARSAAKSRRMEATAALMQARAAEMQARAAMRVAEARAREAESKITAGDREQLRRERSEDREEIANLRGRVDVLEEALHKSEVARAKAVEIGTRLAAENAAMRADFALFHAGVNEHEQRAGRPPKPTPPAFRAVDITQPYALEKGTP